MSLVELEIGSWPAAWLQPTIDYIRRHQHGDGAVAWFDGGHVDPWDHVEAAMGLTIGGAWREAEAAYGWLREYQLPHGGWYASYRDGVVEDDTRAESNFVAYVATGVWHHYQVTGNQAFLEQNWPMVQAAMTFVCDLQTPTGEIAWALDSRTGPCDDALVTGCSSIYKSLECAIRIAECLGTDARDWAATRARLGICLREHPERFDRTWESKARFSMDWFYPVLTGAISGTAAEERIDARWDEFVETGIGCRCVSDEPWVTVAESCELILALVSIGRDAQAREIFGWLQSMRLADGSWWTGYQIRDDVIWPRECPTWTAAAVLLAADALARHTSAHRLLCGADPAMTEAIDTQPERRVVTR